MESSQICSFTGCNNTSLKQSCHFFEFPEDFNLCIQWIEIISSRKFFEDFAFKGPDSFRGRFICSDHFTEEDFVDSYNISSGLKKDAVPFYFIPNRKNDESMENATVKKENSVEVFWDVDSLMNSSLFSVDILNNVKVEDVSSQFMESGDPEQSTFFNLDANCKSTAQCASETVDKLSERRLKSAQRAYLRRQLATPEKKEEERRANAERQKRKRMMETPEQKEIRRLKDVLRSRQRREKETVEQSKIRRMQDAARAQARRQNESEEEKHLRRMKDLERVTRRRRNETEEEKRERLRKNREYSKNRRTVQRWEQEFNNSRDLMDNTFLHMKNFEKDIMAMNFFEAVNSSLEGEQPIKNNVSSNFVGLAYSHFMSNSSQDSSSFDGSVRSLDHYENSIENSQLSNDPIDHHNKGKFGEISVQNC